MKPNYTDTVFYKFWFACLAASILVMTWKSIPSGAAYLFLTSFASLVFLTHLQLKKDNKDE